MNIKINIIVTATLTGMLLTQSALPIFAQNTEGKNLVHEVTTWQNQASHSAQRQQNELQNIIKRSDTLITTRLASLTETSTRLQSDTKLSTSEKTTLSTEIQTMSTNLTTLKTKIDADTDVATARTDEKSIISSYHIYSFFVPQVRLLVTLTNLQTTTANIQALVPQIQALITSFQTQGKDVTQLQTLLADVSSQLQTVTTTLTTDTTNVQSLTETSPTPSTTFTQVHQDISKIIHTGFTKIRSDFSQMRSLFHQLIFSTSLTKSTTPGVTEAINPTTGDSQGGLHPHDPLPSNHP